MSEKEFPVLTLTLIGIGVLLIAMGLYAAVEYIARGPSVLPAGDHEARPTVTVKGATNADSTP